MLEDAKRKILLVEDEVILAMTEKMQLEEYGYEITVAASGEKAVELINNTNNIELILMDINLGSGIDGTEAAVLILQKHDIPIVFLSSHSEREVVEKTEKTTSYGYVVKSSSITVLDASIKMAFKLFVANQKVKSSEATVRKKLESILEPKGDIRTLRLTDIIDNQAFKDLVEQFYRITNVGIGILDIEGNVLVGFGWQDICTKFHRQNPETLKKCIESDVYLSAGVNEGEFKTYKCKNNLWEVMTPIIIEGKHLGNICLGQFFYDDEKIDYDFFINQAHSYGFNETEYIDALKRVRRWSKSTVDSTMLFYSKLASMIAKLSYNSISLARLITEHKKIELALQEKNDDYEVINEELRATFEELQNQNIELLQTQNSLQKSEERYIAFLDNLDAGIVIHAKDSSITMANQRASVLLGLSIDQLKGKVAIDPAWNFVKTDQTPLELDFYPVNRILKKKSAIKNQVLGVVQSKDSKIVWLTVNGFPVLDKNGEIEEILISFIDITDQKNTSKELFKSEQKYRSIIECSSDAIFCVDATGTYQFINHLFASTFGKTTDYFIGKTFWDIYPKEHADARFEVTKRVFATGNSESLEVEVPLADKVLYFYSTANPIKDEKGQVILCLTNAVDITERKLAENKIKNLLAEKELTLKEVHHRLKNNMNIVSSLLNLQAKTIHEPSAIAAFNDASRRLQSMTILYDKLYRSSDFKEVSLKEYLLVLIDEIVNNFPNSKMVKIDKHIEDIMLDSKRLQPLGIIINELLTNIMKYAFLGKTAGLITVQAINQNGYIRLSVQDDGNGMPESVSFENSSGFGLQLIKHLTAQLSGTIQIIRGVGTKVVLEFKI